MLTASCYNRKIILVRCGKWSAFLEKNTVQPPSAVCIVTKTVDVSRGSMKSIKSSLSSESSEKDMSMINSAIMQLEGSFPRLRLVT